MTQIHDRMGKHGLAFAVELHDMSNDLQDLAANAERGRKQWKQQGLSAETRVRDSVGAMQKAKEKSYSLADQYDRARTGERQSGRFGLKKSGAQQEDDLLRKAQGADQEYAQKVHTAESQRTELLNMLRPQAVKALTDLISECDSGLGLQMQKFAALNERLVLGNGLCVNPLKTDGTESVPRARSLREITLSIDNERDLHQYVLENQTQMDAKTPEIKYEKHHALASPQHTQAPFSSQQNFNASQPQFGYPTQQNQGLGVGFEQPPRVAPPGQVSGVTSYPNRDGQPMPNQYPPYGQQQAPTAPMGQQYNNAPSLPPLNLSHSQDVRRPDGLAPANLNEQRTVSSPLTMNKPAPPDPPGQGTDYPYGQAGMHQRSASGPGPGPGPSPGYGGPSNVPNNPPPSDTYRGQGPAGYPPNMQTNGAPPNTVPYRSDGRGPPQAPASTYPQDTRGPPPPREGFPPRGPQNGPGGPQHSASGSISSLSKPATTSTPPRSRNDMRPSLPPNNPVFGISLDELFRRDSSAVPTIVYQCVQAVDLFGLNVEGIYRTSGSAPHIMEMKAMFDHGKAKAPDASSYPELLGFWADESTVDSSQVDFRNPANFFNDIASVTTLLKHFLRDLPDPLLTASNYTAFIQAAKLDDDIVRRDSLHAIINSLPDPNYATLRVLSLHLMRVAQNSERNRMTPSNLAICLGPTLMGAGQSSGGAPGGAGGQGGDVRDAGWQARVVETIIVNTLQIFDDDD